MPHQHRPRPTVVQHFTASGATDVPVQELRDALREYAAERLRAGGCEAHTALSVPGPPPAFVHLEQWSDFASLRRAAHRSALLPRLARVEQLADVACDLAVSVGRMSAPGRLRDAGSVTLLRCSAEVEPAAFELTVGALLGPCAAAEGYRGSELLRSVAAPRRYTALLWWRDAECGERVLGGREWRSRMRELGRTGAVEETVRAAVPAD